MMIREEVLSLILTAHLSFYTNPLRQCYDGIHQIANSQTSHYQLLRGLEFHPGWKTVGGFCFAGICQTASFASISGVPMRSITQLEFCAPGKTAPQRSSDSARLAYSR